MSNSVKEPEDESVKKIFKLPSLVKYNLPVHVGTAKRPKFNIESQSSAQKYECAHSMTVDEVLDEIFPPRCWKERRFVYKQCISKIPATSGDGNRLFEELERRMENFKGHSDGICAIRNELHRQCLDELIRQQTINCIERGLLLKRIRDEILYTNNVYEKIYCSAISYALRKTLVIHQRKSYVLEQNKILEKRLINLDKKKIYFDYLAKQETDDFKLIVGRIEKEFAAEFAFYKKQIANLKFEIADFIFES